MGDPLFERRVLVRNIHLDAKFLQRNIDASLLAQLRMKYEGICVAEGYVQRRSIAIVEHSLGRTNLIKGGLDYTVKFQADICMPHPGQAFQVPVTLKSKIGIHAEFTPIKALLPRDLHIGNTDFEQVKDGEEILFEVVGARFQQGDDSIVVLGKMRATVARVKALLQELDGGGREELPPMIAAGVGKQDESKRVVTVDPAATKVGGEPARKRTLKLSAGTKLNEPPAQGTAEGANGKA